MDSTNSIKWPGPWLDEELTEAESAEVMQLIDLIKEAQAQGVKVEYTETGGMGKEWGETMLKFVPYLNSFMHLVYRLARDGDMPDWIIKDPVGATTSIIEFMCSGAGDQIPGQLALIEPQSGTIEDDIKQAARGARPGLVHLAGFVPDRYMWPIDKITARMVEHPIDGLTYETEVIKANKKKPAVYSKFFLSYGSDELTDDLPAIYGGTWTQRDREVESAYFTLYENGVEIFTPEMLCRTLYGRADSEKPNAQQIGAMTRTIEKHRSLRTMIDCKEEFLRRGLTPDAAHINDPPLMVSELIVEAGGQEKRAYCFVAPPARLGYIKKLRQIASVPRELLNIKRLDKSGHITARNYPLSEPRLFVRNELLRRIEGIKNPRNHLSQKTIALESYTDAEGYHRGLYEIAGYKTPTKQRADEIRSFAKDALEFWKAKGYITGYSFEKKGKTIARIRIDP